MTTSWLVSDGKGSYCSLSAAGQNVQVYACFLRTTMAH